MWDDGFDTTGSAWHLFDVRCASKSAYETSAKGLSLGIAVKGPMNSIRRNNVKISGNGLRTIMFAHGFGCDQAMWRAVAPAFEQDFKVVLFDYVGSGHSDSAAFTRTRYSTLRGYASDVIEIIEDLKLKRVNFVGHSVSSMIGALAAIKRPDLFENLVMIGPSPSYINDGDYAGGFERSDIEDLLELLDNNQADWSAIMAPIIMGKPDRPDLVAELEASFCSTNPIHAQHFARVTFLSDNRKDLLGLKSRTLILQSAQDAIAPLAVGKYVQKCIPESQIVVMDAAGHCPHLSSPETVTRAIREFL